MKRAWGIACAVLGALVVSARTARADIAVGGDFDVGLPVGQAPPSYLATGAGFDLRFGYRFRIPYQPLWITPEAALGYMDLTAHVVRVRPGVRVAFGRFVVPFVYAHLGWGFTSFDPLGIADPNGATLASGSGVAADVGCGVDFAVLRRLQVGAHLGYDVVGVGGTSLATPAWSARWLDLGLGATFMF